MSYTKGYKAFDKGLVCRGFQFEEGKEYFTEGKPVLCESGFHFCKDIALTLEYYPDFDNNEYAEVEVLGEVVYKQPTQHKACTNHIKIIRVIPREEIIKIFDNKKNTGQLNSGHRNSGNSNSGNSNSGDWNSGNWNSGNRNSGDSNSGNWNSGHRNSGNSNSGNWNSGNWNSGNWNSGNQNSGYRNSGNQNSGHRNSGHSNSGNWNSCSYETGFFNSIESETVRVFNKPVNRKIWENARKPDFLYFDLGEGKTYKECFQEAYNNASEEEKALLKTLPNFDAEVFYEISGIRV